MLTHRFQDLLSALETPHSNSLFLGMPAAAFVPCPIAVFAPVAFQPNIAEIYRIAAEQTREQLKPKRSREVQFSMN